MIPLILVGCVFGSGHNIYANKELEKMENELNPDILVNRFAKGAPVATLERRNLAEPSLAESTTTSGNRIYLDLVLIYETSHSGFNIFGSDWVMYMAYQRSLFTWWGHFPERGFERVSRRFGVDISSLVDGSSQDIVVSYGRRLRYLYYYEGDYVVATWDSGYRANPIFEDEFIKDSVYIYVVDKIDLLSSVLSASSELDRLRDGEVPFGFPKPQVDNVPEGFIDLELAIGDTDGALQYRWVDNFITFRDSENNVISELLFWDSGYFVMHEYRIYIDESRFLEWLGIANRNG